VTQYWRTKPNRASCEMKLMPPADCHTTVQWVLSLNFSLLLADYNRGCFMIMWKAQMVVSDTGKCLGWQYPVLLLFLQSRRSQCWFCSISAIKEPAQPCQAGFWAQPLFCTLTIPSTTTHPVWTFLILLHSSS